MTPFAIEFGSSAWAPGFMIRTSGAGIFLFIILMAVAFFIAAVAGMWIGDPKKKKTFVTHALASLAIGAGAIFLQSSAIFDAQKIILQPNGKWGVRDALGVPIGTIDPSQPIKLEAGQTLGASTRPNDYFYLHWMTITTSNKTYRTQPARLGQFDPARKQLEQLVNFANLLNEHE